MKKSATDKKRYLVRVADQFHDLTEDAIGLVEAKKAARRMCTRNGMSIHVYEHILTFDPTAIEKPAQ